jgi:hypothetical protein
MVADLMDCRMGADLKEGNSWDWKDSTVAANLKVIHWNLAGFAGTDSQVTS